MPISPLILENCREAARLHQDAFFKGWKEKDFQELLHNTLTHGLKIEKNHHLCGYIIWRELGQEAEILTLVIVPAFQRMGLGSFLLKALMELLIKNNITKLFLEVAEDNQQAQSFYSKHGFILLSKRPNYYPREKNKFIPALNYYKLL